MERGPTPLVSTLAGEFAPFTACRLSNPLDLAHFETSPQLLAKNKFVDPNRTARVE